MPDSEAYGLTQNFLRSLFKKLTGQLEGKVVAGSSSDGSVKVVLSGKLRVVEVRIEPAAAADKGRLERLVEEAVDDALAGVMELIESEAGRLLGRPPQAGG